MKKVNGTIKLSASDLVGHLNCGHLTSRNLDVAEGRKSKPTSWDPFTAILRERGDAHEKSYIEALKEQGLDVVTINGFEITDQAVEETLKAMNAGASIIVQAAFSINGWHGRADVLRRVDAPSSFGDWSYEAIDTKLARETKSGTVLQLSLYSEFLFEVQGIWPEYMHVIVTWNNFEPISYRVKDFAAYFRYAKKCLSSAIALSEDRCETYPEPKEACDICRWGEECDKKRRDDDHLCLVANISKLQIAELKNHGIATMAALAEVSLPLQWKPERGAVETYERVREQARLQVEARTEGKLKYEVLPLVEGFGLFCLPEPSKHDVFLDIEGNPFVGESGLEYLWGYQYCDEKKKTVQVSDWAFSYAEEKKAFETFIDTVMHLWEKAPFMHIYHYAPYEAAALKRLAGKYATREEELDRMLRAGLFVDIYSSVLRHTIRASVESYSIKRMEPFYAYVRKISLSDANKALFAIHMALELKDLESISDENKTIIEGYNRDDYQSTQALRDWLEVVRADLIKDGSTIVRPALGDGSPSENISEWLERINGIIERLLNGVPVDPDERNNEQQALWILANILDWHRREEKALWWEFFRLSALTADDFLNEKKGISGLYFLEEVPSPPKARVPIHRYRFQSQDTDIKPGDDLRIVGGDTLGKVEAISADQCTIDIKKMGKTKDVHPDAIFVFKHVDQKVVRDSLVRFGEWVADNGLMAKGPYQAGRDILLKEPPRVRKELLLNEEQDTLTQALAIAVEIDGGVFPIQGPPGTGKTFTGANMICGLVAQGKKVGVIANSHKVIRNLVDKVIEVAEDKGLSFQCVLKAGEVEENTDYLIFAKKNEDVFAALNSSCSVAGGTAWLWSREEALAVVDVLFVDEAAQISLANVLAVSQAGKSVVLLGDPQQLDQPMQGSHPEGTDLSALDHILDGHQTIPAEKGLFLPETWRLHPKIASFTSELFYEGKLWARKGLEKQEICSSGKINGSGLLYVPVLHRGNQSSSPEEAIVIKQIVDAVLGTKTTWINWEGVERAVELEDILVIALYNAQVFEIQQLLPGARVGTVDKFQGQEAPITIYSMATSSHADAPRGMSFLYNLNRLNVATSRAKCLSILAACPQVFEPECKTPAQIRLANAFCRYKELATEIMFLFV